MRSDCELLREYVEAGSEAAFTELVNRRLGVVYAVALRQVRGDRQLAEDVASLTFSSLAVKARQLLQHPSITAWLYRTARLAALNLMRQEWRRKARERDAAGIPDSNKSPGIDSEEQRLWLALDEVIAELDERDRNFISLRFFENCSFPQIAARFRLTESGARMRVDRAMDKLHGLLAARGFTPSAVALTAVLETSGSIVPVGAAGAVSAAALSGAIGSASATTFAFMTLSKLQVGIVAAVLAAGSASLGWRQAAQAAQLSAYVISANSDADQIVRLQDRLVTSRDILRNLEARLQSRLGAPATQQPASLASAASRTVSAKPNLSRRLGTALEQLGSMTKATNFSSRASVEQLVSFVEGLRAESAPNSFDAYTLSYVEGQLFIQMPFDGGSLSAPDRIKAIDLIEAALAIGRTNPEFFGTNEEARQVSLLSKLAAAESASSTEREQGYAQSLAAKSAEYSRQYAALEAGLPPLPPAPALVTTDPTIFPVRLSDFDATSFFATPGPASEEDLRKAAILVLQTARSYEGDYAGSHDPIVRGLADLVQMAEDMRSDNGKDTIRSANIRKGFSMMLQASITRANEIINRPISDMRNQTPEALQQTQAIRAMLNVIAQRGPGANQ